MRPLVLTALLSQLLWSPIDATMYAIAAYYAGTTCDGTPYYVYTKEDSTCSEDQEVVCVAYDGSSNTESVEQTHATCSSDSESTIRDLFSRSTYILQANFNDTDCSTLLDASAVPTTGNCEGSFNKDSSYIIGNLYLNGSASIAYFSDEKCLPDSQYEFQYAEASTLAGHSCDTNWYKWYSSEDALDASSSGSNTHGSDSSGLSIGAIVGIICGCVFVLLIIGANFHSPTPTNGGEEWDSVHDVVLNLVNVRNK